MRKAFLDFLAMAVLACCTATLPSCDKDEEATRQVEERVPIAPGDHVIIRVAQGTETKTVYNDLRTSFSDGDEIGIYAVAREKNGTAELREKGNYADNVRYKYVASDNSFVPVNAGNTIYRNPVGVLDIYAYYPYSSSVIDGTAIPHYVSSDQTGERGLTRSDLMAAKFIGTEDGDVTLEFKKLMACLEIIVNKRAESGVRSVTIKSRDLGGVADIVSNDFLVASEKVDIRMRAFEETDSEYRFRAHLPAQVVAKGCYFVEVGLSTGKTKQYNNNDELKLVKGMLTRYDVTLQSRINVIAGTGGTVSVTAPGNGGDIYDDGTAVRATAQAIPGWKFKNWQEFNSSIGTENPYTFVSETNRTITAIFERDYFLVGTDIAYPNGTHPRLGGNGCGVTPGRSYVFETKAQLTASPGTGFHFGGWTDGNGSSQRWETAGPVNMTYVAQFLRDSYSVYGTASPSEGGSVSGGGNVLFGDPASLSASASSGYSFVGWSNGTSSSTLNIGEVNGDMSFTAYFEADPVTPPDPDEGGDGGEVDPSTPPDPGPDVDPGKTYCINCDITGQGTVSGTGCGKTPNTYTLTALPADGWTASWTTKQVTIVDKDINESVTFTKKEKKKYTLTIMASGPFGGYYSCAWVSVNGSESRSVISGTSSAMVYRGEFEEGATVTLSNFKSHIIYDNSLSYPEVMNIINSTSNFGALYIDGSSYTSGSRKTITMSSDQTINCTF